MDKIAEECCGSCEHFPIYKFECYNEYSRCEFENECGDALKKYTPHNPIDNKAAVLWKAEYDNLKAELEQCRKQVKSLKKSKKAWDKLLIDIFGGGV